VYHFQLDYPNEKRVGKRGRDGHNTRPRNYVSNPFKEESSACMLFLHAIPHGFSPLPLVSLFESYMKTPVNFLLPYAAAFYTAQEQTSAKCALNHHIALDFHPYEKHFVSLKLQMILLVTREPYILRTLSFPPLATLVPSGLQSTLYTCS